jgi:hypothetical protein
LDYTIRIRVDRARQLSAFIQQATDRSERETVNETVTKRLNASVGLAVSVDQLDCFDERAVDHIAPYQLACELTGAIAVEAQPLCKSFPEVV